MLCPGDHSIWNSGKSGKSQGIWFWPLKSGNCQGILENLGQSQGKKNAIHFPLITSVSKVRSI